FAPTANNRISVLQEAGGVGAFAQQHRADDHAAGIGRVQEEDRSLQQSGVTAGRLAWLGNRLSFADAAARRATHERAEAAEHLPLGPIGSADDHRAIEEHPLSFGKLDADHGFPSWSILASIR